MESNVLVIIAGLGVIVFALSRMEYVRAMIDSPLLSLSLVAKGKKARRKPRSGTTTDAT